MNMNARIEAAPVTPFSRISRPKLLLAAARAGAALYQRERDLGGLTPAGASKSKIVAALTAAEAAADADRRAGAPGYSPARHVRLLTALLVEARSAVTAREALAA
jgi:hypothetical protein